MAVHETVVIEREGVDLGRLSAIGFVLLIVGALLFALLGPGMVEHKEMLFGSYLFGVLFWTAVTMGCFGMMLLHHATRGSWSISVLRIFESGGGWANMLLVVLLFIPIIAMGMPHLYEWMDPSVVRNDPILQHKQPYLNQGAWVIRFGFYIGLWIIWAFVLRRSTVKQDETKNFKLEAGRGSWGAAGIVMFMLTATFAVTDWIMSMEPHWYSTMYGAWLVVNSCYGALAFATVLFCSNVRKEPYRSILSGQLTKDIGNMLFVLTMLWGYTTLSQFLILWNGNIAETTSYFARRMAMYPDGMQGNWWALLGFIIIIGTFFVPFYCLLAPRVKRVTQNLRGVALWMFLMAVLNMYLIVIPALPERGKLGPISSFTLPDLFALIAVGGAWLIVFGIMSRRAPLVPLYDTRLQEAARNAH
jgi:hypothetical protein